MTTGPEHYKEAEKLLATAIGPFARAEHVAWYMAEAQVHATLALAAATADTNDPDGRWLDINSPGWRDTTTPWSST